MDTNEHQWRTDDFDYILPPELIAQSPLEPRDSSRLLIAQRGDHSLRHRHFRDIGEFLKPGDLLVANESRVIPARLFARRQGSGGRIELLLLRRIDDVTWEALAKPAKRLAAGAIIELALSAKGDHQAKNEDLPTGEILGPTEGGGRLIRFDRSIDTLLDRIGIMPLPPYIQQTLADPERYQTVYSDTNQRGSAAAPTAGLHFTPQLITQLAERGIDMVFVTLHVGLDTFRPVQVDDVTKHHMHSEWCTINEATAEAIMRTRADGGRIIAVGTTTVRVLETAVRGGTFGPYTGWTDIFIYPGYQFQIVDALITNFHLPRSTLLMLVSAFAGKEFVDHIYTTAISERYRFFSFGDALLII